MNVARNAAEVVAEHTTLELECIDRMYLNVYVPMLQSDAGMAHFRKICGNSVPSSALMEPITRGFVAAIKRYTATEGVDLIQFERSERKDERTQAYLRDFTANEGVLYMCKGAGEGAGGACGASPRTGVRAVSVGGVIDGDGQPLLHLHRGRRLRPVIHQVLLLLPFQRQAVPRWARVSEAPVGQPRHRRQSTPVARPTHQP